MQLRGYLLILLAGVLVAAVIASSAPAQSRIERKPTFTDEVDTVYSRAVAEHNRQKFFSILIFVVFGGAATYAQMRGIKKIVSKG
ncbi:MAG: hypothetical protein ACYTAN_07720 [Planctomycetota bacterium]|jgi:hypothetical protein